MAIYSHCAAHQLNLAVVSACKVEAFKSTELTIGEIAQFSSTQQKGSVFLDRGMDLVAPGTCAKKLKDACHTRWIECIDSYTVFLELLPAVHTVLQAMTCPREFTELGAGTGRPLPRQLDFFTSWSPPHSWCV